MRDLARQGLVRRKSSFPKSVKSIIIITLVIVLGLFIVSRFSSGNSVSGGDSEYLQDAPNGLTPVEPGKVIQAEGGANVSTGSITLRDTSGIGGKATANRTYAPGSYTLAVEATLPDPKGNKYQVWISNGNDVFDAGFMNGSKNTWTVVFRNDTNFMSYREVWITKELTAEDDKPENIVMKGSF